MLVQIEVTPEDAGVFFDLLNDDGGMRENAVHQLIGQKKAVGIERYTAFVRVLGAISRGFALAPGMGDRNKAARREEIRRLADV